MHETGGLYYCTYLGYQNEVTFVGGGSKRRPKSEPFVFAKLFRIRGPMSTWVGRREEEREVLNEETRVAASCQNTKSSHDMSLSNYEDHR